jgi:hypothetical protein
MSSEADIERAQTDLILQWHATALFRALGAMLGAMVISFRYRDT